MSHQCAELKISHLKDNMKNIKSVSLSLEPIFAVSLSDKLCEIVDNCGGGGLYLHVEWNATKAAKYQ